MTIDRRLYQKCTGKLPGEAMTRYGESLAKSAAQKSRRGDSEGGSTFLRAMGLSFKVRMLISIVGSLAVFIFVLLAFT